MFNFGVALADHDMVTDARRASQIQIPTIRDQSPKNEESSEHVTSEIDQFSY